MPSVAPTTVPVTKKHIEMTVGNKNVKVDGKVVVSEVAPVVKSGSTYVPLRLIAEAFDAKVDFNSKTKTVTINYNGKALTYKVTVIQNGRTLVPIRYIAENLGAKVDYVASTKQILIDIK